MTRLNRQAAFVLVTLILVIALPGVAVEAMLRMLDRPAPIVSGWRASWGERMRLQRNQLGYRGQPIAYAPGEFVVVLAGDSQVEALACAYEWMPERRLEAHLRALGVPARVVSVGAAGYGQDQELLALREYFERFRADLVIVWETPGNDLWNNTFPTGDLAGTQPKPTFWLEGGTLQGPTAAIGDVISSPIHLAALMQRKVGGWDASWETRLPAPYSPLTVYEGPVNRSWQDLWDQKLGTIPTDEQSTEKSHEAIYFEPPSPRMRYSVALTNRLLGLMAALASEHGAGFLTYVVDTPRPEVGEEAEVYLLNGRYYRASLRQLRANLAAVNHGFDHHRSPMTLPAWRVSPTDGHLNEHAVDAAMRDLAAAVARRHGPAE